MIRSHFLPYIGIAGLLLLIRTILMVYNWAFALFVNTGSIDLKGMSFFQSFLFQVDTPAYQTPNFIVSTILGLLQAAVFTVMFVQFLKPEE